MHSSNWNFLTRCHKTLATIDEHRFLPGICLSGFFFKKITCLRKDIEMQDFPKEVAVLTQ